METLNRATNKAIHYDVGYSIDAEAEFSAWGIRYKAKAYRNRRTGFKAVEVYDLSTWADEGIEKFVGYADELGALGTKAHNTLWKVYHNLYGR